MSCDCFVSLNYCKFGFKYQWRDSSLKYVACDIELCFLTHMALLLFLFGCRLNDIIVSVNGISTENVTHAQAVETLKRAGRNVLLVCILHILHVCHVGINFILLSQF